MLNKFKSSVIILLVMIGCVLSASAQGWWDTTYWDEIRYFGPNWTPDGKICFIKEIKNNSKTDNIPWPFYMLTFGRTYNNFGETEYYLCTMNTDGTDKKEIAKMPKGYKLEQISWARSNSKVVLSGRIFDKGIEKSAKIAAINPNGAEFKYICDGIMADVSSDGAKIAYINKGIWIANINGTNKKRINDNGLSPLWSPDGKMIAFDRYVEKKGKEIWVISIDGKVQKKICDGVVLNWFNDSKRLWTYGGIVDLYGDLLLKYDVRIVGANAGVLSPDNSKMVSEAYFSKRPSDQDRVFYISDIYGNKIYEEINKIRKSKGL